jgi:hypothetical protein
MPPCSTIQQFRDQGMHTADINQLRDFVAGAAGRVWLCVSQLVPVVRLLQHL